MARKKHIQVTLIGTKCSAHYSFNLPVTETQIILSKLGDFMYGIDGITDVTESVSLLRKLAYDTSGDVRASIYHFQWRTEGEK